MVSDLYKDVDAVGFVITTELNRSIKEDGLTEVLIDDTREKAISQPSASFFRFFSFVLPPGEETIVSHYFLEYRRASFSSKLTLGAIID